MLFAVLCHVVWSRLVDLQGRRLQPRCKPAVGSFLMQQSLLILPQEGLLRKLNCLHHPSRCCWWKYNDLLLMVFIISSLICGCNEHNPKSWGYSHKPGSLKLAKFQIYILNSMIYMRNLMFPDWNTARLLVNEDCWALSSDSTVVCCPEAEERKKLISAKIPVVPMPSILHANVNRNTSMDGWRQPSS